MAWVRTEMRASATRSSVVHDQAGFWPILLCTYFIFLIGLPHSPRPEFQARKEAIEESAE